MRAEALTVALRPRSSWEAVELGTALVRRHAAAIWKPWLWLTLPVFALLNVLCVLIEQPWLAGALMWWLKPVFDRVPLYVLSRAVFGDVPTTRQTLREQTRWGLRWLLPYLTWRRLGPARALFLPVDLLEGSRGADARQRRHALGGSLYGVAGLLMLVCVNFELVLVFGTIMLVLLFVPNEYVIETGQQVWTWLEAQPTWVDVLDNALFWFATTLIEPFFIGAGFGLYLNRRTEIEAWDIEIALRGLRARLLAATPALLLCVAMGLAFASTPAHAQEEVTPAAQSSEPAQEPDAAAEETMDEGEADEDEDLDAVDLEAEAEDAPDPDGSTTAPALERAYDDEGEVVRGPSTLPEVFGPEYRGDADLRRAVAQAYTDPRLSPKRTLKQWKQRDADKKRKEPPAPLEGLGKLLAALGKYGLWALAGALILIVLLTSPRWLRWLRSGVARDGRETSEIRLDDLTLLQALPDDIPTAARKLWRDGQPREALALLYRASVETMATRIGTALVPGATEAQCLRASRQLPLAEDRDLFARMVKTWQVAAYAHGLPGDEDFDSLLGALTQRFGWATRGAMA